MGKRTQNGKEMQDSDTRAFLKSIMVLSGVLVVGWMLLQIGIQSFYYKNIQSLDELMTVKLYDQQSTTLVISGLVVSVIALVYSASTYKRNKEIEEASKKVKEQLETISALKEKLKMHEDYLDNIESIEGNWTASYHTKSELLGQMIKENKDWNFLRFEYIKHLYSVLQLPLDTDTKKIIYKDIIKQSKGLIKFFEKKDLSEKEELQKYYLNLRIGDAYFSLGLIDFDTATSDPKFNKSVLKFFEKAEVYFEKSEKSPFDLQLAEKAYIKNRFGLIKFWKTKLRERNDEEWVDIKKIILEYERALAQYEENGETIKGYTAAYYNSKAAIELNLLRLSIDDEKRVKYRKKIEEDCNQAIKLDKRAWKPYVNKADSAFYELSELIGLINTVTLSAFTVCADESPDVVKEVYQRGLDYCNLTKECAPMELNGYLKEAQLMCIFLKYRIITEKMNDEEIKHRYEEIEKNITLAKRLNNNSIMLKRTERLFYEVSENYNMAVKINDELKGIVCNDARRWEDAYNSSIPTRHLY